MSDQVLQMLHCCILHQLIHITAWFVCLRRHHHTLCGEVAMFGGYCGVSCHCDYLHAIAGILMQLGYELRLLLGILVWLCGPFCGRLLHDLYGGGHET